MESQWVENELALSCVEAYFLPWAGQFAPTARLFCDSYLPLSRICRDFAENEQRYENYQGIPRVQESAERLGFASHESGREPLPEDWGGDLLLARVSEDFFRDAKARPWREDHYIRLLERIRGGYRFVNQYPFEEGELTYSLLAEISRGWLRYTRLEGNESALLAREERQFGAIEAGPGQVAAGEPAPVQVRDAAGILKLSRKRLAAWLKYQAGKAAFLWDDVADSALTGLIKAAERIQTLAELARLRGKNRGGDLAEALGELAPAEENLAGIVKMRRIRNEHTKLF